MHLPDAAEVRMLRRASLQHLKPQQLNCMPDQRLLTTTPDPTLLHESICPGSNLHAKQPTATQFEARQPAQPHEDGCLAEMHSRDVHTHCCERS
jgi:hypothetical protein